MCVIKWQSEWNGVKGSWISYNLNRVITWTVWTYRIFMAILYIVFVLMWFRIQLFKKIKLGSTIEIEYHGKQSFWLTLDLWRWQNSMRSISVPNQYPASQPASLFAAYCRLRSRVCSCPQQNDKWHRKITNLTRITLCKSYLFHQIILSLTCNMG